MCVGGMNEHTEDAVVSTELVFQIAFCEVSCDSSLLMDANSLTFAWTSHLYVAYSSSTARQHGYHANDGHGLPLPDLRLLFVCLTTVSYSKLQYTSYHDTAHAHAHTLVCMSSSLVNALSWWGSWWILILYQEHLAWSSNTSYMRHQSIVQHRTHVHSVIHI